MNNALLCLLRWSAIVAFCQGSEKAPVSKYVPYLNVIIDTVLAARLKKEGIEAGQHVKELICKVNEMLKQLVPPGSVNLTKLAQTTAGEEEIYLELWPDGKVKSEATLRSYIKHINMRTQLWNTDFVLLLTGRSMTKDNDPKQPVEGIKSGPGVCGSMTGALVSDIGDVDRTALTITHELSHALGAHHDGEGTARSCPNSERHIMNPSTKGIGSTFSFCSKKAINAFLKTGQAKCLFVIEPCRPAVDPEVKKRRKRKCDELKRDGEYTYARQGGRFCVYSCLFVNSTTHAATRESWLREEDGTPCNASNPAQKCKDGICVQEESTTTEDTVDY
ncbi:zinc metalloproteinase/disintegrin isoform X2 [Rhipicephalus sanguineus]|uniref:zinc metalloproteinase/disintegrin isoform X2 n=1 Tax=Rhipicephalus sanguineus TaxID=34632 RepID=UPI001894F6AB|nr:zinc metalloproteinase/disintegrin isoform X2 [Rhipicephalus sanguineus]